MHGLPIVVRLVHVVFGVFQAGAICLRVRFATLANSPSEPT